MDPRPNCFIAVKIRNNKIISKVLELQRTIIDEGTPWEGDSLPETFKNAMANPNQLHFTLCVMRLEGQDEIETAQELFLECCHKIEGLLRDAPLNLKVTGLGSFGKNVLYAEVEEGRDKVRLTNIANLFRRKFTENGFGGDTRPYKPHMTILNLFRLRDIERAHVRLFEPHLWDRISGTVFGTDQVTGIQLLTMANRDPQTGAYHCVAEHVFRDAARSCTTNRISMAIRRRRPRLLAALPDLDDESVITLIIVILIMFILASTNYFCMQ